MATRRTAVEGVFSARGLGVCLCDVLVTWLCGPLELLPEPLLHGPYSWSVP